ncbi:MAG: hypothetical protein ABEJ64_00200 [Candidatus Nanohaloarchaea archaeon]
MESYLLSEEEVKSLAVAVLVVAAGLAAFSQTRDVLPALAWLGVSAAVILTREFGQRTVAEWIDAYIDVELSMEGASITVLAAMTAYLTSTPIVALFPLTSSFSGKSYEHWGKTIDAIWMKRQFWIVLGGITALFAGWLVTWQLGFERLATGYILFTLFQLLPFDYEDIPTGALDGAYILRWGGFTWLVLMGLSIIGAVLTV